MNMFNKIVQKMNGGVEIELKKKQDEAQLRLNEISKKVSAVFDESKASVWEVIDTINSIRINVDMQLSKIVQARDEEIKQLKNDIAKSTISGGEENRG